MATFSFDDYLADVEAYANSVKDMADDAAERLESLATSPYQMWVNFGSRDSIETDKVGPVADVSDLPTLTPATFDWDADIYNPDRFQMPTLTSAWFDNLGTVLNNEIANGDPNTVNILNRLYSTIDADDAWLSTELRQAINTAIQSLTAKLASDISTGGTGIDSDVQAAIFNEMYERDLQILNDELEVAEANLSRRGFPMPSGMSQAARDTVMARYEDMKYQRSRDITKLIAERAQQNVQFASNALIQLAGLDQQTFFQTLNGFTTLGDQARQRLFQAIAAGNDMEKTKVEYATGYARVFSELTNSLLDKYKAEQYARISEFDGQIKAIMARVEVAKTNAALTQADNELLTKQWQIDLDAATERTKALIQQAEQSTQVKLSAAQSLSTFYSNIVSSALGQINTIVSSASTEE